jgi:hypothetical protein
MHEPTLLQLWENALPLDRNRRERLLAQAAGTPADATLGQANQALLALRESLFGSRLALRAACPQCGADLEFERETTALRAALPAKAAEEHELRIGDEMVRFRAPRMEDLKPLAGVGDEPAAVARALFERCVVAATRADKPCGADTLSEQAQHAVALELEAVDPLASLEFVLRCPECGHGFASTLDVAEATWSELRHRAERLLADVAALAYAYGWREADVLALSPTRRAAYLQLAGQGA